MSEYDEETGFVLSDEDEIAREAALEDERASDVVTEPHRKDSDHTATSGNDVQKTKVPRINKKLLLMVAASLASLIVIVSLVSHPGNKKKKTQDNGTASELLVPDFSVQQKPYEKPEADSLPVVEEEKPVYEAPNRAAVRSGASNRGENASVSVEKDAGYTVSSIIPDVQGRLYGQEVMQSVAVHGSTPVGKSLSALGTGGIPSVGQEEYTASRLAALGGVGGSGGIGSGAGGANDGYREQNMQDDKQAFYSAGRNNEASGEYIASNTVWNGTIIPGVLLTGISTDLPGDIKASVTENIYDSQTGRNLLIPQGSILIATYNSSVSFAQERAQVAWNTLIRPDGYQVSLGNMNGIDSQGYSGTKGQVNEHLLQYAKAAAIISAFTIVNGEFSNSIASTQNPAAQNLLAANQNIAMQLGSKILERTMNIQPTLTVKSGEKINLMVNKNIRFPPMKAPPVKAAYTR